MTPTALALTYHAVGDGPSPLFMSEKLFRAHVDALELIDARTLTVSELASRARSGDLPDRAVALTFDDGEVGAVRFALPLLLERGMAATVFCVAGHLGGASDWPTYPPQAPRLQLAGARELRELATAGVEIGSHGRTHAPLATVAPEVARREVVDSRLELEQAVGSHVRTFAWPYGARPNAVAEQLIEEHYTAACSGVAGRVRARSDVYELPRVDAHYLRRPELLRNALSGRLSTYLFLRRIGSRARRLVRSDYAPASSGGESSA